MAKKVARKKKVAKRDFEKEFRAIMKDSIAPGVRPTPQWNGEGDVFVKFSMYQEHRTIAHPNTVL